MIQARNMYTPQQHVPRHVLPISSRQRIAPHTPTPIGAHSTVDLDIEKIFIPAGADWVVNDVLIAGRSQLRHKNLPGFLFESRGLGGVPRSSSSISFDGLDVVAQGQKLELVVSYVGGHPEGMPFFASVVGTAPHPPPSVLPISIARAIKPKESVMITARLQTAAFRPELIEIVGDASQWVVFDVRVNGRSQFSQAGDIPGDMFATHAVDAFVSMDTCLLGNAFEIGVRYIGDKPEGERFVASVEGSIAALDPANVPELRALVSSTLEDGPGEVVVATQSARPRSRPEARALAFREDRVAPGGADLIEQCSELVMSAPLAHVGMVVEARLVNAPDPELGRKLCFFVATTDGKRAEIAANAVETLFKLDGRPGVG